MSYERLRAILESCAQLELLQAFEAHTYDDSKLSIITEEVLANKIGIKAGGDRKKILKAIQAALAPQCPPEPTPTTPAPSTAAPSQDRTKIFLSYGRRDAAEIAERLHRDLTAAGFEVWRDTQEIQAGSQWQDEIEAGLRSAQVVVSLLSPHAVRRGRDGERDGDSVCLDELARARHRSPPTPIVPAMVAPCDPPFCIYRLDYVHLMDWRNDTVYQAGLKRIIQGIHDAKEGKTSLRTWDAQLRPMDFTDYLHHKRRKFVGREWLFEEIDLWRYESEERALLITGDPGAGKSSVVAQLVHNNSDGQVIGYHCCQSNEIETLSPARFVRSLAAMIASRLPDYAAQLEVPAVAAALDDKRCESDPSGAFLEGILQPLHALPNPEEGVRYILVDALDEAMGHAGSHTIVDVLASRIERLPPWLRIVATTRKEPLILQKLSALRAKSIDASDPRNLADLGLFVRTRLRGALAEKMTIAKVTSDDVVKRISERSGGNFLYAVNVLDGLERDHFSFNELDKLPQGLNALYLDFFQRIFGRIQGRDLSPEAEVSFQKARPLLEVLIAAREPLTLEELSEASGIHLETELPSLERRLAQILSAPLRGNVRTVALYHKSIADWLALKDHVFFVSAKQGVERLARYTASVLAKTRSNPGWYARRHGVAHCIQTGDWETATTALSDLEFVEARARAKELTAMLEDYGGVLNGLPEMQEQAEIETARKATMRRWAKDLAAYTSACIRQRAEGGPKPAFPKPPKAVTFKTDEQIAEECRRITETPTRVDTLTAFQRFIATQKAPLEAFSEQPGFVAQHAYNDAPEGQVHREGVEKLTRVTKPVVLRNWTKKDSYNPHNPLIAVLKHTNLVIDDAAFASNGERAISACRDDHIGGNDYSVHVWNLTSLERVVVLTGHSGRVDSVAITANGSRAISASWDHTLRVWDLASFQCIAVLAGHTQRVVDVSMTADGSRAVSGSDEDTLRVWDLDSFQCIAVLGGSTNNASVAITADGSRVISASWDDALLRVWDIASLECIAVLEGHTKSVLSIALAVDGSRVISGSADHTLRVWDLDSFQCIAILEGHTAGVSSLAVTPDGSRAISGSWDNTLRLWDLTSLLCITVQRYSNKPGSVAVTPDGQQAFWVDSRSIRISNLGTNIDDQYIDTVAANRVNSVALSLDKLRAVSVSFAGRLFSTERLSGEQHEINYSPECPLTTVALTLDGEKAITACAPLGNQDREEIKTFRLWDLDSRECLQVFKGHHGGVTSVVPSAEGTCILSASRDGDIRLWDIASAETLKVLSTPSACNSIAITPDGSLVISANHDNRLYVWDLASGDCLGFLGGHSESVNDVKISPNGLRAVSASDDKTLHIWDLFKDGACEFVHLGHTRQVKSVEITNDGRYAISLGRGSTLRVWELTRSQPLLAVPIEDIICFSLVSNCLAAGTGMGVQFYTIQNLPLGPFITTASRCESDPDRAPSLATARPACCGKLIDVPDAIAERIDHWTVSGDKGGYKDPALEMPCPQCGTMLKMNPFFINVR